MTDRIGTGFERQESIVNDRAGMRASSIEEYHSWPLNPGSAGSANPTVLAMDHPITP